MSFALSPSVNVKELDLSTVVPAVATSICGVAGAYQWGPCFDRKLVTNEKDLISIFGLPNDVVATHWYSAANFLQYGSTLYVTRSVDADVALNATLEAPDDTLVDTTPNAFASTLYIPNESSAADYTYAATDENQKILFAAKYPGLKGNDFKVAVCNADDWATGAITGTVLFKDEFEFAPSDYDTTYFGVVVLDSDDQILEQFLVSSDVTAKDFELNSLYFETAINQRSQYILAYDVVANADDPESFESTSLSGGLDGAPAVGDIQLGYDTFENAEEFDVNILLDGGNNDAVSQKYIVGICETRMDCIAVLNVPRVDVVGIAAGTAATNCATYKQTLYCSSSYGALYGNWKYQYDKYNDKYRWVPISGDCAGIYARTDNQRDPWFAPAGLNRGQIKNVVKLAFNPNRAQRDAMYKAQVNPIVSFASDGPVVWGQKTLQAKPSAFDRVDVRRLFIVLEKAISTASKYFLFEKNTAFTRRQLVGMIDPFLRRVQGREGIYEFHVECSEINNTPAVIDANELNCDIYIQATKTAEFITLTFVATRTGVDFNEYIGKTSG
jgi:hypothetical protein